MTILDNISFISAFQITGLLAISGIGVVLAVDFFRQNNKLHTDVENQQAQIEEMFKIMQYLNQTTEDLKQESKQLRREIDVRGLYDGATDTHLQAINSAKAGATMEHIVENYNISQIEAELIVSMHGEQRGQIEQSRH